MNFLKKTVLLTFTTLLCAFNAIGDKLEVGSDALPHIENITNLKNFKTSKKDFRIYLIGDSITRCGFNKNTISKLKWGYIAGMAASSEAKDYAHLLADKINKMVPNKKIRLFFGKGNNSVKALSGIKDAQRYNPHLIIVQLGEHAKPALGKKKLKENYQKLIDALTRLKPQPLIICTGVWAIQKGGGYHGWGAIVEETQKDICKNKKIPFASVEKYAFAPKCSGFGGSKGVQWHPNDAGQAGYAKEIFKLFKQNYHPSQNLKTTISVEKQSVEEIIFDSNFNNGENKLPINPLRWKIANNSLSSYGNKMAQIYLNDLNIKNFSISCKMRLLHLPDKKNGHCGFIMSDGKGKSIRIYFWNSAAMLLIKENEKTIENRKISTYRNAWEVSPKAKWNDIKLSVKGKYAELNVNGSMTGSFKFPLNTIRKIQIYSYIVNCGIDDFKLIKLPVDSDLKTKVANSSKPVFYAKYDASVLADGNDEKISPLKQKGINFVPGISGQALFIGGERTKALLQYPADSIFADSGTVMFWFQPNWDGKIKSHSQFPWYYLFSGQNLKGDNSLNFFLWNWLRCDLPREDFQPLSLQRKCRNSWLRGDWVHLAFTWNDNGWNKLYVNGLSYGHGPRNKMDYSLRSNVNLKNITKFCVGSIPTTGGLRKNANGAIDELKIYSGTLSDQAIMSEYQRFMPVELVMERRFILTNTPETLQLTIAPLGTFTNFPIKPVNLNMQIRLLKRDSNKIVWSKNYNKLDIKKRQNIKLAIGSLDQGIYILQCLIKNKNGHAQRSFKICVYQSQSTTKVTDVSVKLGLPFININCAEEVDNALYNQKISVKTTINGTKYLQAAPKHGARFAFKVDFPDKYINNGPVMLEIIWPDNIPRSMGLYMFPGIKKFKQHRDRLEGGIQSGEEYPLSGEMIVTKYLFYPSVKSYLFEARTFINNMPAAIASFKVRPLLEPLPELKINSPSKLPARRLGHMDEDQTHQILFNWDAGKRLDDFYQLKVIQQTCNYFAYTGQNTISYPILRYFYTLYDRPGFTGNNFLKAGFIDLFLDIMHKRNMKFIGTINQSSIPEIYTCPDKFEIMKDKGVFAVDLDGRSSAALANPTHPFVRKIFLNQIKEILLRFGNHPAFDGLDLWARQSWTFCSLKSGYGDFTVKLFASESNIKIPDFKGVGRFHQRYTYLTGKLRKQWLKWRATKSSEMVHLIVIEMNKVNPKLTLYINPTGLFKQADIEASENIKNLNMEEFFYKNQSLNFKVLNKFPMVKIAAMRNVTAYRWCRHWDNRESIYDEILYKRGLWKPFLKNGTTSTWSYNRYFETFLNSLDSENYKSYFQNADIKAWGRFFLKEWAFCLAEMDSSMMLIGAQPLGTAGRDEVTREFAMAYRALPALPFKTMPKIYDPLTVRYLNKNGQTWLYVINTSFSSVKLTLGNINAIVTELSNGKKIVIDDGKLKIDLKPYQLRSFKMSGNITPQKASISIPTETITKLQNKINIISKKLLLLKKHGINTKIYRQILKNAQNELNKEHISILMGILHSKQIRKLNQLTKAATSGYLKQKATMLKQGHITVNCGSSETQYFKTSDGKLFLPDRPYALGTYGYIGSYKTVNRNVSKIKGTASPELFASEAYDIEEYRFTVKPGIYTVKLYFKHGWKPSALPGKFLINVDIENKRYLNNMDIFLNSGSDFDKIFIKTINNIKVKDGVLNIKFSVPPGIDSTARLCNAIEVIAE